ncbi:MAG: metal ABC transporter ATP-binding protein [Chloroflexi bacterium]|nr:metal ABC transporter ATP-binding protein [Chloroflexota bacterium]
MDMSSQNPALPRSSPSTGAPALSVEDVAVELGGRTILEEVSFTAGPGVLVGVLGPNGAGKSTLLNAIAGLIPLKEGRILIEGQPGPRMRGQVAYVPQQERVNWRFPATAWDVVMMGRTKPIGWLRRPGGHDQDAVRGCLEKVGMWEKRAFLVSELSGGQRQRVFVARALAQEASILLLDEAFSGVDVASQEGLVSVLKGLRDGGRTILIATHDVGTLSARFDMAVCLNRHVCGWGTPEQVTPRLIEELYSAHNAHHNSTNGENGHPA